MMMVKATRTASRRANSHVYVYGMLHPSEEEQEVERSFSERGKEATIDL